MRLTLLTTIVLLLGTGPAAVESVAGETVYRWVDSEGVVHFGAHPPNDVNAAEIDVGAISAVSPPPAPGTGTATVDADGEPELSIAEQRRQERSKRRDEAFEKRRETEQQCAAMSRQKNAIEPRPGFLVEEEDGTWRRLDDDERDRLLNEANTFINENCR